MSKTAVQNFDRLSERQCVNLLRDLRQARYASQQDSENLISLCGFYEEFGIIIAAQKLSGLGSYFEYYKKLLKKHSPLYLEDLAKFRFFLNARNDLAHSGEFARSAVSKAVEFSITLEGIIMAKLSQVNHIMSGNVTFVEPFFTIAKIRKIMLLNSFSYLPYEKDGKYYLISDIDVAKFWNSIFDNEKEKSESLYVSHFEDLVKEKRFDIGGELQLIDGNSEISKALSKNDGRPMLVKSGSQIIGIVTAFDWL